MQGKCVIHSTLVSSFKFLNNISYLSLMGLKIKPIYLNICILMYRKCTFHSGPFFGLIGPVVIVKITLHTDKKRALIQLRMKSIMKY